MEKGNKKTRAAKAKQEESDSENSQREEKYIQLLDESNERNELRFNQISEMLKDIQENLNKNSKREEKLEERVIGEFTKIEEKLENRISETEEKRELEMDTMTKQLEMYGNEIDQNNLHKHEDILRRSEVIMQQAAQNIGEEVKIALGSLQKEVDNEIQLLVERFSSTTEEDLWCQGHWLLSRLNGDGFISVRTLHVP